MSKFAVISLGCSKNLVDTEIMLGQLINQDWELTQNFREAELILVNTCGFLETAKTESITRILEMAEYKKEGKGVCKNLIVAGCLVQRYYQELRGGIPEVDGWVGLGEINNLLQLLESKSKGDSRLRKLPETPFLNEENLPRFQVTLPHTTYIKIAEGCNHHCSYCAIPLIKGKFRSRSIDSIVKEISNLVKAGVQEINLIAQDITRYGSDQDCKINLELLLKEVINKVNPPWIRLLYAYPTGITHNLLELIATEPSICKYIDVPIQHINPRILKLMNRPYTTNLVKERLKLIRSLVPGITLRTTFIVGFPSETEPEFIELLNFVKEGHFEHVGVFTYSREEGTKAASLGSQLRETTKERRKVQLMEAQQKVSAGFLKKMLGLEKEILIDKNLPGKKAVGRTESFAPDIDGTVFLENYPGKPGVFVKGLITGSNNYNLTAKVIKQ